MCDSVLPKLLPILLQTMLNDPKLPPVNTGYVNEFTWGRLWLENYESAALYKWRDAHQSRTQPVSKTQGGGSILPSLYTNPSMRRRDRR
jgi:hypothetical protein